MNAIILSSYSCELNHNGMFRDTISLLLIFNEGVRAGPRAKQVKAVEALSTHG